MAQQQGMEAFPLPPPPPPEAPEMTQQDREAGLASVFKPHDPQVWAQRVQGEWEGVWGDRCLSKQQCSGALNHAAPHHLQLSLAAGLG